MAEKKVEKVKNGVEKKSDGKNEKNLKNIEKLKNGGKKWNKNCLRRNRETKNGKNVKKMDEKNLEEIKKKVEKIKIV